MSNPTNNQGAKSGSEEAVKLTPMRGYAYCLYNPSERISIVFDGISEPGNSDPKELIRKKEEVRLSQGYKIAFYIHSHYYINFENSVLVNLGHAGIKVIKQNNNIPFIDISLEKFKLCIEETVNARVVEKEKNHSDPDCTFHPVDYELCLSEEGRNKASITKMSNLSDEDFLQQTTPRNRGLPINYYKEYATVTEYINDKNWLIPPRYIMYGIGIAGLDLLTKGVDFVEVITRPDRNVCVTPNEWNSQNINLNCYTLVINVDTKNYKLEYKLKSIESKIARYRDSGYSRGEPTFFSNYSVNYTHSEELERLFRHCTGSSDEPVDILYCEVCGLMNIVKGERVDLIIYGVRPIRHYTGVDKWLWSDSINGIEDITMSEAPLIILSKFKDGKIVVNHCTNGRTFTSHQLSVGVSPVKKSILIGEQEKLNSVFLSNEYKEYLTVTEYSNDENWYVPPIYSKFGKIGASQVKNFPGSIAVFNVLGQAGGGFRSDPNWSTLTDSLRYDRFECFTLCISLDITNHTLQYKLRKIDRHVTIHSGQITGLYCTRKVDNSYFNHLVDYDSCEEMEQIFSHCGRGDETDILFCEVCGTAEIIEGVGMEIMIYGIRPIKHCKNIDKWLWGEDIVNRYEITMSEEPFLIISKYIDGRIKVNHCFNNRIFANYPPERDKYQQSETYSDQNRAPHRSSAGTTACSPQPQVADGASSSSGSEHRPPSLATTLTRSSAPTTVPGRYPATNTTSSISVLSTVNSLPMPNGDEGILASENGSEQSQIHSDDSRDDGR